MIPVRRSNQLSYEATDIGSWSFVSSKEPVKNGCEVIYEMFHILNCGFEILVYGCFFFGGGILEKLQEFFPSVVLRGSTRDVGYILVTNYVYRALEFRWDPITVNISANFLFSSGSLQNFIILSCPFFVTFLFYRSKYIFRVNG